jgi:predicted protein tyrosine phosphatase
MNDKVYQMKIKFISRTDAIKFIKSDLKYHKSLDIISISDTNKEKKEMRDLWINNKSYENAAIFLNFHDIDGIESGFTEQKARKIIEFVKESHAKKKDILVHCFVGISRSGAVAKFINDYFMEGDRYLDDYVGHNLHIYYTLLELAGVQTMRQYYGAVNASKQ